MYAGTSVAYYAYAIIGHALFGQAIGRRVAGIRVTDMGGAPIGWRRRRRVVAQDAAGSKLPAP